LFAERDREIVQLPEGLETGETMRRKRGARADDDVVQDLGAACPLSGRTSIYHPVQILEAESAVAVHRDDNCGQLPFSEIHLWRERHTQGLSPCHQGTGTYRRGYLISVEIGWRVGAYMIRSLCSVLVLSCVVGLTGLMTGSLWNRYAKENAFPRLGAIYQGIAATGAGLVELTKGYAAPATRSQTPSTRSQAKPGPFEE
jgi:hypothetical protein